MRRGGERVGSRRRLSRGRPRSPSLHRCGGPVSELPEDARQAAVEAIIGEESGYCGPGYGTCGSLHVSSEHAPALADAALAAALPFLERATRDKIAAEPPFPVGTYVVIDARKRGPWGRVYRARLL